MTEPNNRLAAALHGLRSEIRDQVPVPAAAGLRDRATRALRIRRATTAVVAAAAAAAIALGGNTLLRPTAAPPADPPTPAPVTPSPRPAPRPVEPVGDPIAEVDWLTTTITIPPQPRCPSGAVTFGQDPGGHSDDWAAYGPNTGYPRIVIDTRAAYGDLTGDGQPEAVLSATCFADEEDSGDGRGQLLVVTRTETGDLRALAWVGPRGAVYHAHWITDRYLYTEASPHLGESFEWAPGTALRYQWNSDRFSEAEVAPEYPPLVSVAEGGSAAPVRPRAAVASALGCPDRELRFAAEAASQGDQPLDGYTATAGGATYGFRESAASSFQHLFDLDNTGIRLLVTPLACTRADGTTAHGLAVFEPVGDGWQGISLLMRQAVAQTGSGPVVGDLPIEWELTATGLLSVVWRAADEDRVVATNSYRWNGTELTPVED